MNRSESKYFNTAVKMDQALIALLKKKTFEYITVSELCKAAEVNRSTFYLHYENMNDLLEETTSYVLREFLSYFSAENQIVDVESCELEQLVFASDKYLIPYLAYAKENREVFLTVLSHVKLFGFADGYDWMYEKIFDPILSRFHYAEGDRKYVMSYYLNGITSLVVQWLRDGCDRPIEDVSRVISTCIYGKCRE